MSIVNIINEVCDFFTEYSDIQITKDLIINKRMREVLIENPRVNHLLHKEIYYRSRNVSDDTTFDELCKIMSIGWFNYDRYTKQYSNMEMDDIIEQAISQIIDNNIQIDNISNTFQNFNL
jgi:hypothetical protein